MQLTMRDLEMLRFINDFGFCEASHLKKHFNLRVPRCYQLISRLISGGFLKAEKIFFAKERILMLTREGAKHTNLPPLKAFSFWRYQHTIHVINVYLELTRLYPEATWKGEREIVQEGLTIGDKKYKHTPDALLIFSDGTRIAIEIELTSKARARWEKIAQTYNHSFEVNEVWYFGARPILGSLRKIFEKRVFIKLIDLNEFLSIHRDGNIIPIPSEN